MRDTEFILGYFKMGAGGSNEAGWYVDADPINGEIYGPFTSKNNAKKVIKRVGYPSDTVTVWDKAGSESKIQAVDSL